MEGIDGGGRRLASSSGKLGKDAEEMGAADEDHVTRGGPPEGIRDVFQGGSTGGVAFWVVDVGDDPPHGTGSGEF